MKCNSQMRIVLFSICLFRLASITRSLVTILSNWFLHFVLKSSSSPGILNIPIPRCPLAVLQLKIAQFAPGIVKELHLKQAQSSFSTQNGHGFFICLDFDAPSGGLGTKNFRRRVQTKALLLARCCFQTTVSLL